MNGATPVVAVVGRPNVGKSTLFNRIVGRRLAIVDDTPGVTRDRNFARADWAGRSFFIVDTGGVVEGSDLPLDRLVRDQALAAIAEADLVIFLADGHTGVHPLDQRLADTLRDHQARVLLVVNKLDNLPQVTDHHEFWTLGLGEPLAVSALSGKGSGDLLDQVVARLPEVSDEDVENSVRVAVIGKPNVGKSSLVNRLFGEERVVVSEVPGTTRDPVDSEMRYHGRVVRFIDTAGLRRHSRIKDSLEYYSALRTERVVREADVCLVVVDATEELHVQDVKVAEQAWEAGCGVVLVVNKWDLVDKDERTAPAFEAAVHQRTSFLRWVPVLFVSAETGQRVRKVLDLALEVADERERRIGTAEVNQVLGRLEARQPPPHHRGRPVNLKYGSQVEIRPPTFVVFSNYPSSIPDSYVRYLENGFRAAWTFQGSPIRIRLRKGKGRE